MISVKMLRKERCIKEESLCFSQPQMRSKDLGKQTVQHHGSPDTTVALLKQKGNYPEKSFGWITEVKTAMMRF